ncbi:MAG: aspartate aminotransferase family protein [Sulfurimonadaceae bacterium]|jgi:acetylornithine aminotransferase|nr:aspartate aminotransferase family protein [Sulfurimonadaceae bacterium]
MDTKKLDKDYILSTYARADVEFVSGQNATLFDANGKKYIDFASGIAVCSVGHANKRVNDAICNQIQNLTHTSNLYYIAPQAKAAKKIVEASGYDMKCFFGNSGAEANEGALKIARKYGEKNGNIKKYKVITLEHSFHGRTITTVKATGQASMHNYFGPYPDGFVYANNIKHVYELLDEHTCAVMIELVQGEGGVQPLCKKNIKELAVELKKRDILLIIDEVQTGVYRTGEFLASNYYEIEPDIITLAKGLGGGVPIGVVMTSLKDIFSYGDHGSTFGGNFLSSAAASEVMDILSEEYKSGALAKTIEYFTQKLTSFYEANSEIFTSKVGIALMCGLRVKDGKTLSSLIDMAREEGVVVLKAGRDTLRILPALTISKDEIDEGFEALQKAVDKIEI